MSSNSDFRCGHSFRVSTALSLRDIQNVDSEVSMTFDSWTSFSGEPFLSITAHYIDTANDNAQKWELRSEQLAFAPIHGNHSGENIAKILLETINKFAIRAKVCFTFCFGMTSLNGTHQIGWFTADNATNNDTALKALGKMVDPDQARWDPVSRRVRSVFQ